MLHYLRNRDVILSVGSVSSKGLSQTPNDTDIKERDGGDYGAWLLAKDHDGERRAMRQVSIGWNVCFFACNSALFGCVALFLKSIWAVRTVWDIQQWFEAP